MYANSPKTNSVNGARIKKFEANPFFFLKTILIFAPII